MANEKVGPVDIRGRALTCQFCGHSDFHTRIAQLNTPGATFFGLDWANRSAICYICDACGYIHWFLPADPMSSPG